MYRVSPCKKRKSASPVRNVLKAKFHSRTGYEGAEGEYKYSSTIYLTSALGGSGWTTPSPGRFAPGKVPLLIV